MVDVCKGLRRCKNIVFMLLLTPFYTKGEKRPSYICEAISNGGRSARARVPKGTIAPVGAKASSHKKRKKHEGGFALAKFLSGGINFLLSEGDIFPICTKLSHPKTDIQRVGGSMRHTHVALFYFFVVLLACKNQYTRQQMTERLQQFVPEDTRRYYAFRLKAFRDQHGKKKEYQLTEDDREQIASELAVRFSHGSDSVRGDNPFIEVRNMHDPADCELVESLYDPDADAPIYEKGGMQADYRKRLLFSAFIASGRSGGGKLFTFQWYWGVKFTDYGVIRRFTIKQLRNNDYDLYFLPEEELKMSSVDIKSRFFSVEADKICAKTIAQKANKPPVSGVWYYAFVLPKFKGASTDKKMTGKDRRMVMQINFSPTKGGSQYASVIVRNMDNPSSCYSFARHAMSFDWKEHNGKLYAKHIEIAKKYLRRDTFFVIKWLLDSEKNAHLGYFYLDEKAGGHYHEYSPAGNAAHAISALTIPSEQIAKQYFPASSSDKNCS